MKAHFQMMAAYNAWANARLAAACAALPDRDRRRDLGAAFGSLLGTINHLLVTDVLWCARIRGDPPPRWPLDHIAHDDFDDLAAARAAMDDDIIRLAEELTQARIAADLAYVNVAGESQTQPLGQVLAHVFNHQTHHRGQCHAMLTRLTGAAPALDLIYYVREQT